MRAKLFTLLLALTSALGAPTWAAEAGDCSTFTWDMTRELRLFAQPGTTLVAGSKASEAPRVEVDTLYALDLHPLSEVVLAHAPGKTFPANGVGAGGLLTVRVPIAGRYRITLDAPMWLDVINAGQPIESSAFQGQKPCTLIHKTVEWALPANVDLIIQVTGGAREHAKLAVTAIPKDNDRRPPQ